MRSIALLLLFPFLSPAAVVPFDRTGLTSGPVSVAQEADAAVIRWDDGTGRHWRATFSLDPAKPLITSIDVADKVIIERAQPVYRVETGKRRGGWDAFFDFPPSHTDGTRRFLAVFRLTNARAKSIGDRVELSFDGLKMGIFEGSIRYIFFPGSRLIEQLAVATTNEPD